MSWNATDAAKKAGYSEASARAQGSRLLTYDYILQEIEKRLKELKLDADEVLLRLGEQARAEYAQYIILDSLYKACVDLEAMQRDGKMHLIKAIKETKYGQQIEFHDVQTALQLIGRHHKLFVDRNEVSGAEGGPVQLKVIYDNDPDGQA